MMNPDFYVLSRRILSFATRGIPRIDFLREVSRMIIESTGCDEIELRLKEGGLHYRWELRLSPKEAFNFEIPAGVRDAKGQSISCARGDSVLERLCRDVLSGHVSPASLCLTRHGSFWTGDTDKPLDFHSQTENATHLIIGGDHKSIEVMMITGYPTIESAVTAVKSGAEDFLAKPFTDEELFSAVQQAFEKLERRRAAHQRIYQAPRAPQGLLGESEAMQKVLHAISKAASTSATVLITGESGTGKELVARAIHYSSPRVSASFVPVHCGAIPEALLESELFGHAKGAFTGATETRNGFFQTADGGTIFLDEISETSPSMQVRLLRVLQDKEVYKVGSTTSPGKRGKRLQNFRTRFWKPCEIIIGRAM